MTPLDMMPLEVESLRVTMIYSAVSITFMIVVVALALKPYLERIAKALEKIAESRKA